MIDFEIFWYLIPFGVLTVYSLVASYTFSEEGFSFNVFMIAVAIGVVVLIWVSILPPYTVLISVLLFGAVIVSSGDD